MLYTLPKSVEIDGTEFPIRYDFRCILDIIEAMNDPDLSDDDKALATLQIFYPDYEAIKNYDEALKQCFWFIDCGDTRPRKKKPRLIDWESDFEYIIAPVNRVLGYEARAVEYNAQENTGGLHWWTFVSAYMEIGGDCLLSTIVSIRDKQARGKKLEKYEREWARNNADLLRIKQRFSESDDEMLKQWTGGGNNG